MQLAPKEFDLLWELLDHRGLVLTRDQLLERVWGYTFAGDTRTVDVHVRQLRRKLGDASPIVTVWGVGYKVSPARDAVERSVAVFDSLRFRLPAIFLAAVVLAGLVSSLIAIRLFQDYTQSQTAEGAAARVARDHAALRRAGRDQHVLGEEPREGDRRQALLRRCTGSTPPGREGRPAAGAGRRGRTPTGARGHDPQLRVHAARREDALRRRRPAAQARPADRSGRWSSRSRRRRCTRASITVLDPARDRLRGRRRRSPRARRVPLAADHRAGARALATPPTRSRAGATTSTSRGVRGGGEIGQLHEGFRRWRRGSTRPSSASATS